MSPQLRPVAQIAHQPNPGYAQLMFSAELTRAEAMGAEENEEACLPAVKPRNIWSYTRLTRSDQGVDHWSTTQNHAASRENRVAHCVTCAPAPTRSKSQGRLILATAASCQAARAHYSASLPSVRTNVRCGLRSSAVTRGGNGWGAL
jgi:hypothetical protein